MSCYALDFHNWVDFQRSVANENYLYGPFKPTKGGREVYCVFVCVWSDDCFCDFVLWKALDCEMNSTALFDNCLAYCIVTYGPVSMKRINGFQIGATDPPSILFFSLLFLKFTFDIRIVEAYQIVYSPVSILSTITTSLLQYVGARSDPAAKIFKVSNVFTMIIICQKVSPNKKLKKLCIIHDREVAKCLALVKAMVLLVVFFIVRFANGRQKDELNQA